VSSCTRLPPGSDKAGKTGAVRKLAARDAWRQALAILDDVHLPDAAHIRAKLREYGFISAGT